MAPERSLGASEYCGANVHHYFSGFIFAGLVCKLHCVCFIFVVPRLLLALYSVMSRFGSDVQEDFISLTGQIRLIFSPCCTICRSPTPPPHKRLALLTLPSSCLLLFFKVFICAADQDATLLYPEMTTGYTFSSNSSR